VVTREDNIPDLLAEQIARPVQWTRALATVAALDVDALITVGPGAVLRGLCRRAPGLARTPVLSAEDAGDVERTLASLVDRRPS
jgi:malonyl CoA-acyl carrier protein transacylase